MKAKLTIPDRVALLNILPKEGNFFTLRIIRSLTEKLSLTPEEYTKYGIVVENGIARWNDNGKIPAEISFEEAELGIIKSILLKKDGENMLPVELFSAYEQFILPKGD